MPKRKSQIVGRTIVQLRAMTQDEISALGWYVHPGAGPPTVLILDDDSQLFASIDDEGNGPGVLWGVNPLGGTYSLTWPRWRTEPVTM